MRKAKKFFFKKKHCDDRRKFFIGRHLLVTNKIITKLKNLFSGSIVEGRKRNVQKKYDGNCADMDEFFKSELSWLINYLLNPKTLKAKKISGKELTGSLYLNFIEKCFKLFQSDKLPETPSTYLATVDKHMRKVVDDCFGQYRKEFDRKFSAGSNYEKLKCDENQSNLKTSVLEMFDNSKKMGVSDDESRYRASLVSRIDNFYEKWTDRMDERTKIIAKENEAIELNLKRKHESELKRLIADNEKVVKQIENEKEKRQEFDEREAIRRKTLILG